MTNEEKIEEIVIDAFEGWSKVGFTYDEIIAILSKLAKWKDEQFKEFLEKKREKYYKKLKHNDIETLSKINELNEIIGERFKEE